MGQGNGVLLKEVSAFQRCPLIEVLLYILLTTGEPPIVDPLIVDSLNIGKMV